MRLTEYTAIRLRSRLVVVFLLFPALAHAQNKTVEKVNAGAQDELTLEDIFKVWRERGERTRTLRSKWTQTKFIPKLFLNEGYALSEEADKTLEIDVEYAISGGNVRAERSGEIWDTFRSTVVHEKRISTYNDTYLHSYYGTNGSEDMQNGGKQYADLHHSNVATVSYWPMIRLYRIADPELGILKRGTWTLGPRKTIDGRRCVLVENRYADISSGNPMHEYFFVDTERDMVLVEIVHMYRGTVGKKFRVQYEKDASGEWNPVAWHFDEFYYFGDKRVLMSARDIVVTHHETNQKISDDEFSIVFPTGTLVTDRTAEGDNSFYLVKSDGSHRPVANSERMGVDSFEKLRSNIAAADASDSMFWWVAAPVSVLLTVCITWWIICKRRERGYFA